MEGLGELGFWLAVGAVVVALIVRGWLKERDRHAMLRDLARMETGSGMTEVLAYLRERDAAEEKLTRQMWGLDFGAGMTGGSIAAVGVGIVAFLGGLISLALMSERTESGLLPIGVMAAFWATGGAIAWLIVHRSRQKKHGPPPGP
jgi:hypothetical protein